jgi:hypothetical protein
MEPKQAGRIRSNHCIGDRRLGVVRVFVGCGVLNMTNETVTVTPVDGFACQCCDHAETHKTVFEITLGCRCIRLCECHAEKLVGEMLPLTLPGFLESADGILQECWTREELSEMRCAIREEDVVAQARNQRAKALNRLTREHERRITSERNAPHWEEIKRWNHDDKIYFGRTVGRSVLFRDSIRQVYDINAGDWCRVWLVQPRKKIVWLCQPGKPAKRNNVIEYPFSITTLRRCEASRTELELRDK